MTQSKPKPKSKPKSKPDRKKLLPRDRVNKLLVQCSSKELEGIREEINQLLWERQLVAKPLESLARGEVGVDGFVFLEQLQQELADKYESKKA